MVVTATYDGPERSTQKSQLERAYEALQLAIVSCEIAPESKIRIAEVCEIYGFSTGSVREALSRLTADGFVVAEPQKGFRAAPISIDDLKELTESRIEVERLCLKLSIEKGDVSWEGKVLVAHHGLQRIPIRLKDQGNKLNPAWAAQHEEFHLALAAGCQNRWLMRLRQTLYQQSERYRQMSVPLESQQRDIEKEHKDLCDAALDRDIPRASLVLQSHLEKTTEIILNGLWPELIP